MSNQWKLEGTYFEACNCEIACPCVFLNDPSEGECMAVIGWHIDAGARGDVSLDGLNVATMVYAPGNMAEVDWSLGLYIDDSASDAQEETLTEIFSGAAGGHFETIAEHVGEVLGVKRASITFQTNGKTGMTVDDVMDVQIDPLTGQNEQKVTIENHPLAVAPGFKAAVHRSDRLTYKDFGRSWDISGKNGFVSPFRYEGP